MPNYRVILRFARPERRSFLWIFLITTAASALAALQPWPMKLLVDHVLERRPWPPWLLHLFQAISLAPETQVLLIVTVLGGLLLFALNSTVEVASTWAWTNAGRRTVYHLAEDLFARLQRRSVLYHTRTSVGDSMGRVTVDSWVVYQLLDQLFFAPGHALLTIGLMVFLMAQLDETLTILSVAVAPLMIGASFIIGKPLRAAAKIKREIETRLQSHLQQTLVGIPVVQAFVQEERESVRFQQFADAAIRVQQRSTLVGSLNALSSGLVTALGTGLILWVGARHYLAGTLSIGSILAFLVYLGLLQNQMKVFANLYTTLQGLRGNVDRVLEILNAEPDLPEKENVKPLPSVRGHVQLEHVSFGYETSRPVLREVSLEAKPGQTIAIVGPTGAGKTTLVNLVPRFFDPWTGTVRLDGHDLRDLPLQSVRRQVALVLQESFLFPVSIAENIAFGRPDATRDEIEAAARAANAHEFIERLPQGYDTAIGERGATLSGGERQRIAIARALVKNAPILILDEPTSALDAETEHLILAALDRLMEGRTTLVIAHRLSTVRKADRIVVLNGGIIAESGTHDELLQRGQLYARMHNIHFAAGTTAVGLKAGG